MPANLYSIDSRMIRHPNCRVSSEPYPERGCTAKDSRLDNKHSTHPLNLRQAVQINARTVRRPRVRPKSPGKPRRAQHLERTRPLPHSADGLTTHTYAEARPARHTISQASQFGYEYTPTHANQSLQPTGTLAQRSSHCQRNTRIRVLLHTARIRSAPIWSRSAYFQAISSRPEQSEHGPEPRL